MHNHSTTRIFTVSSDYDGARLDRFLTECLASDDSYVDTAHVTLTRSQVNKLIVAGQVLLNTQEVRKAGTRLSVGDQITCVIPAPQPLDLIPDSSVDIEVLYEDEELLVINKHVGQVVHPGAGNYTKTLVHGLLAYLGDSIRPIGDTLRPGIVHRLDRDTTGALLVAKSEAAYRHLVQQFLPPRCVTRKYLAVTRRLPKSSGDKAEGCIRQPIGRHPKDRKKMAVVDNGKAAASFWSIEEYLNYGYLVGVTLETGRTHQIRVHLQSAQAHIIGDPIYGEHPNVFPPRLRPAILSLGRQALHASSVSFIHPATQEPVTINAPLPSDIDGLLNVLRSY